MFDADTPTTELERAIDKDVPAAKAEALARGYHPEAARMNRRCTAEVSDGRLEYWSDGRQRAVVVRTNPDSNERLAEYKLVQFGSPGEGRAAWQRYIMSEK